MCFRLITIRVASDGLRHALAGDEREQRQRAAGNLTSDGTETGTHTCAWDAEGR